MAKITKARKKWFAGHLERFAEFYHNHHYGKSVPRERWDPLFVLLDMWTDACEDAGNYLGAYSDFRFGENDRPDPFDYEFMDDDEDLADVLRIAEAIEAGKVATPFASVHVVV